MAHIGHLFLWFTLFASLYSVLTSAWGVAKNEPKWVERAKNGLLTVTGLVLLTTTVLLYLLLSRDFQVRYVHAHTSSYQPTLYVFSALWAGQEGSFLLWALLYSIVTALVIRQRHYLSPKIWPHMLSVFAIIHFFFALLLVSVQNPFLLYPVRPAEGAGILPVLENPGMVLHPPILFLGYAIYSVPFAFTMASLIAGEVPNTSLDWLRRWSLMAWLFLGLGILIGAWWAYVELGWGGYWAWDPVESASLIPWLTGTAYLHSLLAQKRYVIFRRWTAALAIATFLLCFFGTLVTRGGIIISELHGFAASVQPVAYYLIGFILAVVALSGILFSLRRDLMRDELEIEGLSRASSLLITNLLLVGFGAGILVGILFPHISRMVWGIRIHLDSSFYNRVFAPLACGIILLLGICPLLGWRETSPQKLLKRLRMPIAGSLVLGILLFVLGIRHPYALFSSILIAFAALTIFSEFARMVATCSRWGTGSLLAAIGHTLASNRRRYGALLVHLSILLIAVGITGSSIYKTETLVSLAKGETTAIQDYTLRYEGMEVIPEVRRQRHIARLAVYRGSSFLGILRPEKNLYQNIGGYLTEVAIRTTLMDDLYVALDWPEQEGRATFRISVYPLVIWLWIGGGLLLLGTLIAIWPEETNQSGET